MTGRFRIFLPVALTLLLAVPAHATDEPAEIERKIEEYLVTRPDVLERLIGRLSQRKAVAEAERRKAAIADNAQAIFSSPYQATLGDPNGNVTLVEFFDYNCAFCRRALPNLLALMDGNPKLRVVLKEFPILGPKSVEAARVAVAARMQEPGGAKYLDFHKRLLNGSTADRTKAFTAAREAGFDMARLEKDLTSPEIDADLGESRRLAAAIGIRGTPTYVIGDEVVIGAVPTAVLKEKLQRTGR